jgi:predicted permease
MMSRLREAARLLTRRPTFSLLVTAVLGLGVGACATILTMVYVLLLKPLPFKDPDRLVVLETRVGNEAGKIALREYRLVVQEARLFEGLAAYYPSQYNLAVGSGGSPEALPATISTSNLLEVLGLPPILGGMWPSAFDFQLHFPVVLSHGLWHRAFGADRTLVGKTIELDRRPYQVVGIAPPGVDFPDRTDVFRSITDYNADDHRRLNVVGRLEAGVTVDQAAAEIDALGRALGEQYPDTNAGVRLTVTALRDSVLGDSRPYFVLLLVAAGLIVVLTCANVGNMLLAHTLERQTELAVRRALGATTGSLARQLVAEGLFLAAPAAVVGAVVAAAALAAVSAVIQFKLPIWLSVESGASTPLLAGVLAVAVTVASNLVPLIRLVHSDTSTESLKAGARGSVGRRDRGVFRTLAVVQTALAVALLIYAGLLTRTVWRLLDARLGFEPAHLLTFRIDPPWGRYPDIATTSEFYRRAVEALAALPGVEGAAINQNLPLGRLPDGVSQTILVEGETPGRIGERPFVTVQPISPGYFPVMRIPLLDGRDFTPHDREPSLPVAIVGESLARRYWPGQSAIGKRFRLAAAMALRVDPTARVPSVETVAPWLTVVGVAGDVKHEHVTSAAGLDVYVPHTQVFAGDAYVVVRTAQNPPALAATATRAIQSVDVEQSVFAVQPMTDIVDRIIWQERLVGSVFTAFAVLALALALAGLHGMLAQDVVRRRSEIGVRLALGSTPTAVIRLLVTESAAPLLVGSAVGAVLAGILARATARVLYQVSPLDPLVYASALVLVVVATTGTTWLVSRRAARINPSTALQSV